MAERSSKLRSFYASLVCGAGGVRDPRIVQAFAAVKREPFAGPGPWQISQGGHDYVTTPDDDCAFLYQNTLIALDAKRGINIGQPSMHALWLNAVDLQPNETVLQIGAGTGYYTAIIAHLVGPGGRVHAYEIDPDLAARAAENLKQLPNVDVRPRTGIADDLPKADAVYVCAGITQPSWAWLDALRPGGRLLFPLQPETGIGGMLLIRRPDHGARWPAKFVSRARFVCCDGRQDSDASRRLNEVFSGPIERVQSFRTDARRDDTCWYAGDGWWLSTAPADAG
jgi:protein-L-isoaspartate(D-aspartate) O-methyltransferase